MSGDHHSDHKALLRSQSSGSESDLEAQLRGGRAGSDGDFARNLDRRKSSSRRGLIRKILLRERLPSSGNLGSQDKLVEGAPPEWALLLIGCLLGVATGLCVAAFNHGVHIIHEWAWAGTPREGAAWFRLQRLADTWHRILLIPLTGGVIVGVMHGLLEIVDQIKQPRPPQRWSFDLLAGLCPTIKAIQAAVTLGTGCSLGPEGPSVDIGKSCAYGCSEMMQNNRERRIALVAAGAAAGISSGFNAAVAGCFFAIETVLRPHRAENSPPFTTAMIILASVLSSTVSNGIIGGRPAFSVPTYELKSAAELPLYLMLGMICGVVSVVFSRLVSWFTKSFEFVKEHFGIPAVIHPALGGLGAGLIALRYPGILYWGFTNVDEILRTGKNASAPGIWLLTQILGAKVVSTALCKGSGLVGGLYAPSLMIGAAVGAVFGGLAAEVINAAIPGNAAVAHPQAYALVGMAATLASVCSVPLTSVLLLFELTKDYRILLPLMGAVGLAIWVASVANQTKDTNAKEKQGSVHAYSSLTENGVQQNVQDILKKMSDGTELELCVLDNGTGLAIIPEDDLLHELKVAQAMSKNYIKVSANCTVKDAIQLMIEYQQKCVLVVDDEDLLEGIMTLGDLQREVQGTTDVNAHSEMTHFDVNTTLVSSVCTRGIHYRGHERGILICYPDTDLMMAKEVMEAREIKQLPVIIRVGERREERCRKLVGLLYYDAITDCLRAAKHKQVLALGGQSRIDKNDEILLTRH
uniref:Chloride channel protein n=1 Tax=Araucaria cunninghamii TaxID=56994 RepID=A0A0D6QYJ3_ARACU